MDTGRVGWLRLAGTRRRFRAWILTAVRSRHRFVYPVFRESTQTAAAIEACEAAWAFFGGIFHVLIPDNTKAIVQTADDLEPRLVEAFLEYAQARALHIDPTRVRHPKDNGEVERQIRYLRDAFFAARPFRDVDDLNAQLRRWRDEIAHRRPHPEQRDRTVAEVFAEEQPRLLPLPAHPFDTETQRVVAARKQPYVPSDRNLYTIPHTHVGQPLTLLASAIVVRIVAGAEEIALHVRSYDTGQAVEDPARLEGLLAATRQANASSSRDHLRLAVPLTTTLLDRLAARGEVLRPHLLRLQALLDDYGPRELAVGVALAVERNALGAGSISHILEARRWQRTHVRPVPVILPDHPGVRDLTVTPHPLESCDDLGRSDPDDPDR